MKGKYGTDSIVMQGFCLLIVLISESESIGAVINTLALKLSLVMQDC